MKTKSKISGYIIRSGAWAVFLSVAFIAASSAFDWPNKWNRSVLATVGYNATSKSPSQPRAISFAERVAYQRAIEDVYWHHRIWPRENPDPKPSLDAVMSQGQLEKKVTGYLRDSLVLQDHWQKPITAEQLQAEMDRMARDTKQPEVLQELFEALGNDPAVIAECLARPILAERLITDLSVQDQTPHVESPQTAGLGAMPVATTLGQVVYTLPKIAEAGVPPCTDQWGTTTTFHAPSARGFHTAVWTGSEMIVWGGGFGSSAEPALNTGARYNPSTDSWAATRTANAPSARGGHTAVWSGSEMIIWGGTNDSTGGRYNPSTDSWAATSTANAPSARGGHTAVWTGSEMIVWGGADSTSYLNTGGKYNPRTDSWTATSTTNAPSGEYFHTAVWTGSEMIIWNGYTNTGGRYSPNTDSWTATSSANAPSPPDEYTAIWTGSEMIIWGGYDNTGGRYNPRTDTWIATSTTNAPTARRYLTTVWTGSEMIVWGGVGTNLRFPFNTGGTYNPSTDSWRATSTTNAPSGRVHHKAAWADSEMIVWGGYDRSGITNTGGRYCGQYPPPLSIIQPNGGEVWSMGSTHEIKWEGSNLTQGDRLIIQYSRDGGAGWFRIAQDVPALSSGYWWHVDNFPTTQGRVKILLQGHREINDQSDANFTVQRQPFITLLRPNGGEVFPIGLYRNIHWIRQNPGGNTVDIDYSTDNGTTWITIATQAPDTGWYLWHVPGPVTTMAKARIRFHETPSVTDASEAVFTIVSP